MSHQDFSPVVRVPEDLISLETDFQRTLYVENRISQVVALKHDKLQLKERFLQALVPLDLQKGYSDEINRLSLENRSLRSEITSLRSKNSQFQREQIIVKNVILPVESKSKSREELDSEPVIMSTGQPTKGKKILMTFVVILLLFMIGRTRGISCSPSSVESDPVGVEHSKGGTTNGQIDQPQQGPSSSGKGNRRLP